MYTYSTHLSSPIHKLFTHTCILVSLRRYGNIPKKRKHKIKCALNCNNFITSSPVRSIKCGNVLCEENHISVHGGRKVAIFGRDYLDPLNTGHGGQGGQGGRGGQG